MMSVFLHVHLDSAVWLSLTRPSASSCSLASCRFSPCLWSYSTTSSRRALRMLPKPWSTLETVCNTLPGEGQTSSIAARWRTSVKPTGAAWSWTPTDTWGRRRKPYRKCYCLTWTWSRSWEPTTTRCWLRSSSSSAPSKMSLSLPGHTSAAPTASSSTSTGSWPLTQPYWYRVFKGKLEGPKLNVCA